MSAEFKAITPEYMERIIQEACDRLGYRILAPGELDGETLEAAAKVADKRAAMAGTVSHEAARALLEALPDAIRALKDAPAGKTDGAKQE
ncbi:hypothetical protein GN330_16690 [Nitratireductor sp. CAU 1489]|uniref:Uncharacterized protein n=1 Tax=Nitratireductor arenosus TaxID=2682096 RepID=A0A844QI69_9HYPH|nr:hypothetical protein [Nitratireductor arenosus]MVA98887.1 hypothetical protein [Nitratireductor arenosus]